jgi:hypothetical protein
LFSELRETEKIFYQSRKRLRICCQALFFLRADRNIKQGDKDVRYTYLEERNHRYETLGEDEWKNNSPGSYEQYCDIDPLLVFIGFLLLFSICITFHVIILFPILIYRRLWNRLKHNCLSMK